MTQAGREALVIGIGQLQTEMPKGPPMIHAVDHWIPQRVAGALGIAKELGLDAYRGQVDKTWPRPTLVVFLPKQGDLGEFWKRLEAEFPLNP